MTDLFTRCHHILEINVSSRSDLVVVREKEEADEAGEDEKKKKKKKKQFFRSSFILSIVNVK